MSDRVAIKYTRGWEVFGHMLAMIKASLKRHLAISLLCGTLAGLSWFYGTLTKGQRGALPNFAKCSILQEFDRGSRLYEALGRKTHKEACTIYTVLFGRKATFLVRQAGLRVLLISSLFFCLLSVLLVKYGGSLKKDESLRGTRVISLKKSKGSFRLDETFKAWQLSSPGAALLMLSSLGSQISLLPDLVVTWLATRSSWLLSCLSPGVPVIWYQTDCVPGFRDPFKVLPFLEQKMGSSLPALLWGWLGLSFLGTALFLVVKNKLFLKKSNNLILAGLPLPVRNETKHFLFCGSPGSGKSTAIKSLLRQIRQREQKTIIYDCSGEYVEEFYDPEKDLLLNPLDKRSVSWHLWSDATSPADFYGLGRSLFPGGGKDPFWNDASAQVLADLARVIEKKTYGELAKLLLDSPLGELQKNLKGTPAARFLDPQAAQMPHNLLASMASKLGAFKLLPDGTPFSLREFVREKRSAWLFITSRQDQHQALKPLISLWCDLVATEILSLPPDEGRRIWLVLDELASLQRLPALPPLLERGRKHGAACILGLQSLAQLRDIWGPDGAAALASQPQNWLILRTVEPDAARWLQDALGAEERRETQENLSMGADPKRDGSSLSRQTRQRPVVLATEIMNLPDLTGYLTLPGSPVYQVTLDLPFKKAEKQPGFVQGAESC